MSAADVVLPAAGYAEVEGTTTNLEGRVSTVAQRVTAPGTARADWIIAADLAARLGADLGVASVDDLLAEIEAVAPTHAGLAARLVAAGGDGVLVEGTSVTPAPVDGPGLPAADSYSPAPGQRSHHVRPGHDGPAGPHDRQAGPARHRAPEPPRLRQAGHRPGHAGEGVLRPGRGHRGGHLDPGVPRDTAVVPFNAPGGAGGDLISDGEP